MNQTPINAVIYDTEILNAIQYKEEPFVEGIIYVEAEDPWRAFDQMGISVITAYDMLTDNPRIFMRDNLDDFQQLLHDRAWRVTFNGVNFDDPLLRENGLIADPNKAFDLLRAIWSGLGHDPDVYTKETHGSYGLGAMCEANLGEDKIGHGAIAPIDWQQGKYGKTTNYCMDDTTKTRKLLQKVIDCGYLIDPVDKKHIMIELPLNFTL